jgi:hypothetical protein
LAVGSTLKDLLSRTDLDRRDKLLLILTVDSHAPKRAGQVREIAIHSGLPEARRWNISAILGEAKGLAIRSEHGWELTSSGRSHCSALPEIVSALPPKAASALRGAFTKIKSEDARAFVSEAVECFERGLYRAAVVLSRVGALSLVYSDVVENHLAAFNSEALKRDPKWRTAKTEDDLARMKEHDFLNIVEALSIIGKSVKEELQASLKFRNGCGHPNTLKVAEHRVASHIETLTLNVFARFPKA